MTLKYKVISTYKPGEGKLGEPIYLPKLTGTTQVNLRDIATILAKRSSASEADVYLVIVGLVDLLPELLGQGKTVKIERLGTFRLHAKVKTDTSSEKITSHNIKEIRVSFKPDNEIKRALQGFKILKEAEE
jgi:predicted histone-like DNA-binding protein